MVPLVVVTGASQGIGAAIAERFANRDAAPHHRIALVATNATKLDVIVSRCISAGADARAFVCDVTDTNQVEATRAAIAAWGGTPDVLVNNAGRYQPTDVLTTPVAVFREQIEVNLFSAYLVTRAFLPAMVETGSGHIFYLCSVASTRAYPGASAYCAAKHGLLGLARAVREETKETGVRVTAILPGPTLTPSWAETGVSPQRLMPADDIARSVVDVCALSPGTVVEELLLMPQRGDL